MHVYGELTGNLSAEQTLNGSLSSIINRGVDVVSVDITTNGIYTAPSGKAYSPVTVNVRQPSGTKQISITQNGTTTEDVEWYEDAELTVNVPNTYTASDEGKVVSSGALVGQTSRNITANGTVDTTLNDEVVVNVQPPLEQKTVTPTQQTQNVEPTSPNYGLSRVTVEPIPSQYIVPNGTLSITENGTYDVTEKATADVNVKPTLLRGILRPDAELVKTYSYDKWIVADEGVTLPSYSTTQVTLKASELLDSLTMDVDYNYFLIERFLSIPTYSINTKNKGRVEYTSTVNFFEVTRLGVHKALIDNTIVDSNVYQALSLGGGTQQVYFTSTNVLSVYTSASYGIGQTAGSIAVGTTNNQYLRINSPNMNIRGYTNYLTQEYYDALTDIRYQYVINVWRAPKDNLNLDAWMGNQELWHINECAESVNHKLT